MRLEDARRVLGLGPDEDPAPRMAHFEATRQRIIELIRSAPNDVVALHYQQSLVDFERALQVLQGGEVQGGDVAAEEEPEPAAAEEVGSEGEPAEAAVAELEEVESVPEARAAEAEPAEQATVAPTTRAAESEETPDRSRRLRYALYVLIFVVVGGVGGGWLYFEIDQDRRERREQELMFLQRLGQRLVEARRWPEAEQAYDKMEQLDPGSQAAHLGRRSIEVGMREEQEQFVGYWQGEALAAFEAGRFEDAAEAARRVLERYPNEREVAGLLDRIEEARVVKLREEAEAGVEAALAERDWQASEAWMERLAEGSPGDPLLAKLSRRTAAAKEQARLAVARAHELAQAVRERDTGNYDPQLLAWMNEARVLAPGDPEIEELYERIASYARTLRVPEDHETLAEALLEARPKDRVVLAAGEYEGGFELAGPVQLEGAGPGETILKFTATRGPALRIGADASGAKLVGIGFHQLGFDAASERFPVVMVEGAEVSFSDCHFVDGSGHGLAVLDGGRVRALRCEFRGNGWGGLGARGEGTSVDVEEGRALGNFGHGFEAWGGARISVIESLAKDNSRNGVLVDSAAEGLMLRDNEMAGNREYGIVLTAGASGQVTGNHCHGNLLGGLLVRFAAISVRVEENRLERNAGPGLLLEQGLRPDIYRDNRLSGNRPRDVAAQAVFEGVD